MNIENRLAKLEEKVKPTEEVHEVVCYDCETLESAVERYNRFTGASLKAKKVKNWRTIRIEEGHTFYISPNWKFDTQLIKAHNLEKAKNHDPYY